MFVRLTRQQRSMIEVLLKRAKVVWFYGIDQQDLPVIAFQDVRRKTDPFTVFRVGLARATGDPRLPLRDLTEQEQDLIDPDDHELLSCCLREPYPKE